MKSLISLLRFDFISKTSWNKVDRHRGECRWRVSRGEVSPRIDYLNWINWMSGFFDLEDSCSWVDGVPATWKGLYPAPNMLNNEVRPSLIPYVGSKFNTKVP